jgi:soluble lytic murein transglycosylase-like protein
MSTTAHTIASKVRVDARSGRLVRSKQVIPRLTSPQAVEQLSVSPGIVRSNDRSAGVRDLLQNTARKHEVEPELVESVIKVESNFNPHAISSKGAEGLMQLIPSTARRFGVQNSFDPAQNIEGGVRYLKHLLEMFKGDERLALAAYNAGEGAVVKHKGVPPYPETQNYVHQVGKRLGQARRASVAKAKPAPEQGEFSEIVKSVDAEGREFYRAN